MSTFLSVLLRYITGGPPPVGQLSRPPSAYPLSTISTSLGQTFHLIYHRTNHCLATTSATTSGHTNARYATSDSAPRRTWTDTSTTSTTRRASTTAQSAVARMQSRAAANHSHARITGGGTCRTSIASRTHPSHSRRMSPWKMLLCWCHNGEGTSNLNIYRAGLEARRF